MFVPYDKGTTLFIISCGTNRENPLTPDAGDSNVPFAVLTYTCSIVRMAFLAASEYAVPKKAVFTFCSMS